MKSFLSFLLSIVMAFGSTVVPMFSASQKMDVATPAVISLNPHATAESCKDGHQYESETIVKGTEWTDEIVRHTCKVCGDSYLEFIPAQHSPKDSLSLFETVTALIPDFNCAFNVERGTVLDLGGLCIYVNAANVHLRCENGRFGAMIDFDADVYGGDDKPEKLVAKIYLNRGEFYAYVAEGEAVLMQQKFVLDELISGLLGVDSDVILTYLSVAVDAFDDVVAIYEYIDANIEMFRLWGMYLLSIFKMPEFDLSLFMTETANDDGTTTYTYVPGGIAAFVEYVGDRSFGGLINNAYDGADVPELEEGEQTTTEAILAFFDELPGLTVGEAVDMIITVSETSGVDADSMFALVDMVMTAILGRNFSILALIEEHEDEKLASFIGYDPDGTLSLDDWKASEWTPKVYNVVKNFTDMTLAEAFDWLMGAIGSLLPIPMIDFATIVAFVKEYEEPIETIELTFAPSEEEGEEDEENLVAFSFEGYGATASYDEENGLGVVCEKGDEGNTYNVLELTVAPDYTTNFVLRDRVNISKTDTPDLHVYDMVVFSFEKGKAALVHNDFDPEAPDQPVEYLNVAFDVAAGKLDAKYEKSDLTVTVDGDLLAGKVLVTYEDKTQKATVNVDTENDVYSFIYAELEKGGKFINLDARREAFAFNLGYGDEDLKKDVKQLDITLKGTEEDGLTELSFKTAEVYEAERWQYCEVLKDGETSRVRPDGDKVPDDYKVVYDVYNPIFVEYNKEDGLVAKVNKLFFGTAYCGGEHCDIDKYLQTPKATFEASAKSLDEFVITSYESYEEGTGYVDGTAHTSGYYLDKSLEFKCADGEYVLSVYEHHYLSEVRTYDEGEDEYIYTPTISNEEVLTVTVSENSISYVKKECLTTKRVLASDPYADEHYYSYYYAMEPTLSISIDMKDGTAEAFKSVVNAHRDAKAAAEENGEEFSDRYAFDLASVLLENVDRAAYIVKDVATIDETEYYSTTNVEYGEPSSGSFPKVNSFNYEAEVIDETAIYDKIALTYDSASETIRYASKTANGRRTEMTKVEKIVAPFEYRYSKHTVSTLGDMIVVSVTGLLRRIEVKVNASANETENSRYATEYRQDEILSVLIDNDAKVADAKYYHYDTENGVTYKTPYVVVHADEHHISVCYAEGDNCPGQALPRYEDTIEVDYTFHATKKETVEEGEFPYDLEIALDRVSYYHVNREYYDLDEEDPFESTILVEVVNHLFDEEENLTVRIEFLEYEENSPWDDDVARYTFDHKTKKVLGEREVDGVWYPTMKASFVETEKGWAFHMDDIYISQSSYVNYRYIKDPGLWDFAMNADLEYALDLDECTFSIFGQYTDEAHYEDHQQTYGSNVFSNINTGFEPEYERDSMTFGADVSWKADNAYLSIYGSEDNGPKLELCRVNFSYAEDGSLIVGDVLVSEDTYEQNPIFALGFSYEKVGNDHFIVANLGIGGGTEEIALTITEDENGLTIRGEMLGFQVKVSFEKTEELFKVGAGFYALGDEYGHLGETIFEGAIGYEDGHVAVDFETAGVSVKNCAITANFKAGDPIGTYEDLFGDFDFDAEPYEN